VRTVAVAVSSCPNFALSYALPLPHCCRENK
jgi:hypothetical protein